MSEINQLGKVYERPWGTYQTINFTDKSQTKIITVKPQGQLSLQKHFKRAEHWVVVTGRPTITVDDNVREYNVGEHIFIPKEAIHRLENFTDSDIQIIEVQVGDYLGEDDIVRLEDIYKRN
ncbi:phosphomannose isomerase type II C-terminal cupin domain [Francisella hispaniensis]|uniref:Mannose-6-phosphate isomerase n=2 Tax=Francisella hispaniensis TaxID=622488 RepID=F4BJ86_9GAMM|nr:phosphomannose isomerase type II C-terminal cupin domain [Francisella hispaniensis]AEB28230.1 Mannose-6-phosphate isomerase [Francisella hispaniensis]APD49982.1 mannose-6-phosphate isomerase [Francisella hispaniensis FSC454]KYW86229.1 mannose-6-phosphate isomerase [Francisella hispaniensis FSC454]MBK2356070.1 phosphomannose isomerase type II C-terminal cupin domain [Francisella hispaniensis]